VKLLQITLALIILSYSCSNQKGIRKFHYPKEDNIEIKLSLKECLKCPRDPDYKKTIKIYFKGNTVKHVVKLSQETDLGFHFGNTKINSELRSKGVNRVIIIRDFYEGCKILDVENNKNISDEYLKSISQYECDSEFDRINNQINFESFIFFNGKDFYKYSGDFIAEKKRNGTY